MTATPTTSHPAHDGLADVARFGDLIVLATVLVQAVAALAIGQHFGSLALALVGSAVLVVGATAAFLLARGTLLSCAVLTACNVLFVALHVQLGRGTVELHFGAFVLLGLLLVYRDWRPIVLAAGLIAVHHLVFDRLQAAGFGVYCTPEPSLLTTLMHAMYVLVQTGAEIWFALHLRLATIEVSELSAIARRIDRGGELSLDVRDVPVNAPVATLLKATVGKIDAAMTDVRAAVASIEGVTSELANGNLDLSQRTEEQASNLQQTAASMEQLTATVRTTADTAGEANHVAASAASAAAHGGDAVGKVVATMDAISESSKRIADITAVIDGIAFRTNILALNAAVEAARAGEQGRGFSVVAAEVRSLAQRSATAAKEIKTLIGDSVDKVNAGTQLVHAAGGTMTDIVAQARRVSELIGAISDAAGQQSSGIEQVGGAVTQLDSVTQQNAALVEQSAAAADNLRHQAARLNAVVNRFRLSPRRG